MTLIIHTKINETAGNGEVKMEINSTVRRIRPFFLIPAFHSKESFGIKFNFHPVPELPLAFQGKNAKVSVIKPDIARRKYF